MIVALYVRVSTDEQAKEGVSIAEQKERLQAYATSQGWREYEFYIDDGYSAKDTNRPAFQRMVTDVQNGRIQAVVTTKIDRLTRRLLDLLQFTDFLDENECVYKSSSEAFDTSTAAGRMVLQLLGVFAEFERERIAERVKDNMQHLAHQGKPISRPCFGYDLIDKQLVINEEEAKWVRKIAEMYIEGYGPFQLAKLLNKEKVLTKNRGQWSAKAIRVFFTENRMLIGDLVWNKQKRKGQKLIENSEEEWIVAEGTHPPILHKEIFDAVQEKIDKTKGVAPRSKRSNYLLSGMVQCGHCGSRMIGTFSKWKKEGETLRNFRYICSNYQKKGLCFNHYIQTEVIEPYVLEKLGQLAKGASVPIHGYVETSTHQKKVRDELSQAKRNLKSIGEKWQRQKEAYEEGVIPLAELKDDRTRLDSEKLELEEKIKVLEAAIEDPMNDKDIQKFIHLKAKELKEALSSNVFEIQQNAVREIIHEVQVFDSKEVQLSFKL